MYREIIAVCSEIHTEHINTLCGLNVEFVNVKPGDTQSNHYEVMSSALLFIIHDGHYANKPNLQARSELLHPAHLYENYDYYNNIQGVSEGTVNILGGGSMDYSE